MLTRACLIACLRNATGILTSHWVGEGGQLFMYGGAECVTAEDGSSSCDRSSRQQQHELQSSNGPHSCPTGGIGGAEPTENLWCHSREYALNVVNLLRSDATGFYHTFQTHSTLLRAQPDGHAERTGTHVGSRPAAARPCGGSTRWASAGPRCRPRPSPPTPARPPHPQPPTRPLHCNTVAAR